MIAFRQTSFLSFIKKHLFLLLPIAIVITSCKKNNPAAPPCVAGTGGFIQVVLFANHANTVMYNYATHLDTTYVKYNTLTFPGCSPDKYDTYFVSQYIMRDHIHCTNLKCGNYYFYRTTYDSVNNITYHGGIGMTVEPDVHEIDQTINVN